MATTEKKEINQEIKKMNMRKQRLSGKVVSTKMKDTTVVEVNLFKKIPKYGKFVKRSKKYLAHDVGNTAKMGETVLIEECRPMSKRKHFIIIKAS